VTFLDTVRAIRDVCCAHFLTYPYQPQMSTSADSPSSISFQLLRFWRLADIYLQISEVYCLSYDPVCTGQVRVGLESVSLVTN